MLLIWTLPFLNFDLSTDAEGFQSKIKNKTANSVDPDEMAHSEMSHLDLHYVDKYWFWSARTKGLKYVYIYELNQVKITGFVKCIW